MKVIFASHNENKIKEVKKIISDKINLMSLSDLGDYDELSEDFDTFEENALLKAQHYANKYQSLVIADDSGLCVYELNLRPGVHSKRYSGKGDIENNILLLKEMENKKNRKAYYKTIIAVCDKNLKCQIFEGLFEGTISYHMSKVDGFGYDRIFIPNKYDKPLSEINIEIKNKISHRYLALKKAGKYINEYFNYE